MLSILCQVFLYSTASWVHPANSIGWLSFRKGQCTFKLNGWDFSYIWMFIHYMEWVHLSPRHRCFKSDLENLKIWKRGHFAPLKNLYTWVYIYMYILNIPPPHIFVPLLKLSFLRCFCSYLGINWDFFLSMNTKSIFFGLPYV